MSDLVAPPRVPGAGTSTSPPSSPGISGDVGGVLEKQVALADLLDVESFRQVIASFADLYRVGVKVFDSAGNKLVDLRVGNAAFCGHLWEFGGTRQACTRIVNSLKNDPFARQDGTEVPRVVDCFSGLRYVVLPLHYEGDLMGRLIFGPYLPHAAHGPSDEIYRIEPRIERANMERHVETVRRAPDDLVSKVLMQLQRMVEVILYTSYRSLLTSRMHIESVTASHAELQAKNRALAEQNDKLKELDKMKSNFLATVSHELRTPLTSVIGYSEMLLEGMAGALNDEQRDYVKTIMDKGESLLSMITQILDLSKMESGTMRLHVTEFDVAGVLKSASTAIVPQCTKKNIRFEITVPPGLPFVRADRDKVGQVVVNLLGNAVKFTPVGGTIKLTASRVTEAKTGAEPASIFELPEEAFLRIAVEDSGVGIPSDQLGRIFDRFFQVDNSSTREFGGTGLGLSIVRNFIEAHHGKVRVQSTVGKGSTFEVLLPLDRPG